MLQGQDFHKEAHYIAYRKGENSLPIISA